MIPLLENVKRSIFIRLLLIFGITVILFFVIISVSLQTINQRNNAIETIPDYFTRNIEDVIEDIGTPPNLLNALRLARELDWSINIRNPIMRWSSDADNRLDVDSSTFNRTLTADAQERLIDGEQIITVQRGGYDFFLYQRSIDNNVFSSVVIYGGLAFAAFVLFLNYFMVNKLLNPIRQLRRGTERISKGDLGYRVKINRQDELGELTQSINHMADSLQSMLEAKRQLLLAISHELRAPIPKAKLRLEFMPFSDERKELGEDLKEIELLISDLIEAERLNDEHSVLTSEPIKFAEFVKSVTNQYIKYEGGFTLSTPVEDEEFFIDKLRIRLLLTNLMSNAIRHGEENPIEVKVSFASDHAILEIIDHGEGISAQHLMQISEPFYRVDSSRQRNTGGFGLGLYLCRLIAQAHGGGLNIESELDVGTHITVDLARNAPEPESD
jgi:signal transduction histidine kinase